MQINFVGMGLAAGLISLAACSSDEVLNSDRPLDTDMIKDPATAIRLGQEACLATWALTRARTEPDWKASLHNRMWHFWLQGKSCEVVGGDLDAATGKQIGGCSVCVT